MTGILGYGVYLNSQNIEEIFSNKFEFKELRPLVQKYFYFKNLFIAKECCGDFVKDLCITNGKQFNIHWSDETSSMFIVLSPAKFNEEKTVKEIKEEVQLVIDKFLGTDEFKCSWIGKETK